MWRVIVVLILSGILRLDQRKVRKVFCLQMSCVLEELVRFVVVDEVVRLALMLQDQRTRKIKKVNLPGFARFVEAIEKRRLVLAEDEIVQIRMLDAVGHLYMARSRSRKGEETIGPGRARHRRKP